MNKRQLAAAEKVIDADCTGKGSLARGIASERVYCALGGLGKAAGVSDRSLMTMLSYLPLERALKKKFGLDAKWINDIWRANDSEWEIKARRREVKKVLRKAYDESVA